MDKYSHRDTGFLYFEQGQVDKAIDEFNRALKLDPQDASTHFGAGLCCYEKGEISRAMEEFGQVLEINPQHLQANYHLGLCYYQKKEFPEALSNFQQAIILDPKNKYVYCQMGQAYFEQRQYNLALKALKKAVKINPNMPSAHQTMGTIYLEQNLYGLAEIEFKKTVLLDPDNIFARQMLGYAYRKQGKHDLAVNEFIKTTNFCLKKGNKDKERVGCRVKIVRMPDFCGKIKNYPKELHYTLLPPLALGQITAYLRGNAVEVDQDDLNIKIHYDNRCPGMADKEIDAAIFFDEDRILRYVSGAEDAALESIMEEVARKSEFFGYKIILLSLREIYLNTSSLMFTLSLARFLKKKHDPILILGGSGQSIDLLNKYDCKDIDHIIYGDGETVLLRLLLALKNESELLKFLNSKIKADSRFIPTELVDVYPPLKPDFAGLPIDKYRYSGFGSYSNDGPCEILEEFNKSGALLLPFKFIKGCPHECVFCTMSGNKLMHAMSPANAALYLKELQDEFSPTGFFFLSDTINISKQYVNELCDEIIKNKTKILWSDCARADNLDRDTLFKMRKAGCIRLIFGIETASPRLLKYIRKGIGVKRLEDTLKWSDEAGIWTGVEIICGLPHEKDSDVEETIRFLNRNKKYINTLYINQFDLRDGSTFLPYAKDLGIENIRVINQYASEEFPNFHKYGYDETDGLRWEDKKKQIGNSYKKLLSNTCGNSFFTYELEHFLFFLYNKFGDKKLICDIFSKAETEKNRLSTLLKS